MTMTPLDLQRIVDGEIEHDARARILGALGENAKEWRSLALALIEEQQWSRQIPSELIDVLPPIAPAGPTPVLRVAPETVIPSPRSSTRVGGTAGPGASWFHALAASLLLGIGMAGGMFLRSTREYATNDPLASDSTSAGVISQKFNPQSVGPSGKMLLTGLGGARSPSLEIPLMDAMETDPNRVLARDARDMANLQQQLKRQGLRLDWKPRLYSGRLNDGRQVVVPIHNVSLKSVGL
jgi:hypothetical protein